MSVTIIGCPRCRAMLLSDTVACPACGHILDEERYKKLGYQTSSTLPSSIQEDPCPKCGEMVRRGLVRCWNCNTFMQQEIAEAYREMRASPQPVIYSPLPDVAGEKEFETEETYQLKEAPDAVPATLRSGNENSPPDESASPDDGHPVNAGDSSNKDNGAEVPPPPPSVPHSVATAGDALLQVALAEEAEEQQRKHRGSKPHRKVQPRSSTALLVFCPQGHRIEVDEKYRGRTGRCPKCKSPFFVPEAPDPPVADVESSPQQESPAAEAAPASGIGKYVEWMEDVPLHSVNPERLKLKPGSLQNDFQLCEVAFAPDEVLLIHLTKKKGAAGAGSKKRLQDREAVQEHLRSDQSPDDLPAVAHYVVPADKMKTVSVAQPPLYPHESLFADVPVFGAGRIAVRIPLDDDPRIRRYLSFGLSRFRRFAQLLSELFGVEHLGEAEQVPLHDSFTEARCHYSEETFRYLNQVEYYLADPEITLKRVGRKCQSCGLIISEDSRKKEKIGGPHGKSIARAKCPKCTNKFGDISLYDFDDQPPPPPAPDEK